MQQTTISVSGLALGVQQIAVAAADPLHTAFTATTHIGLFHPFTLLIPEVFEAAAGDRCCLYCLRNHAVTSCVIHKLATWHRAAGNPVVPECETRPVKTHQIGRAHV